MIFPEINWISFRELLMTFFYQKGHCAYALMAKYEKIILIDDF